MINYKLFTRREGLKDNRRLKDFEEKGESSKGTSYNHTNICYFIE